MDMNEMDTFEVETIVIPLEDGSELECAIMDEIEVEGINYMVIAPIEDGIIGEETYFYRFHEDGEDVVMDYIDDEEELKRVAEIYWELLEEEEGEE